MSRRGGPGPVGMVIAVITCLAAQLGLTGGASAAGNTPSGAAADPAALERDVRALAADALQGRALGSPGIAEAMVLVAQRFQALGLEPGNPAGGAREILGADHPLAGYLQEFQPAGLPTTANVIGLLPGRDPRPPRALVIGAHLDHLGRDEELDGDQIYNGADDNASGVAALLEIARLLATGEVEERDRTVVFIAFSAEESGLLGSKYYCEHPVVPLEDVIAMINLDSVGRMENHRLYVFGTGSARELPAILQGLNNGPNLDLVTRTDPVGGSDHMSFLARRVPAVFFFTGPHADYSRVTDEADRIHYDGLATVTDFAAELARYLRYRARGLSFEETNARRIAQSEAPAGSGPTGSGNLAEQGGQRPSTGAASAGGQRPPAGERRVSLGFMPDFASEAGGVMVGQISPGGAAARAGLETGDVILAVDGETVASLADYAAILRMHAPGDRVKLSVRRGTQNLEIAAELQERK